MDWLGDNPPAPVLRCLDAVHLPACQACSPPPLAADEATTELFASGGKTGEKRLRSLLTRTSEWASAAARDEAARVVVAERGSAAEYSAEALRRRLSAQLRKCDLLFLARHWGYRSDIWRPRQPRPLIRRPEKPPAPTQPCAAQRACAAGTCGCSAAEAPALACLLKALASASNEVDQVHNRELASSQQLRALAGELESLAGLLSSGSLDELPLWRLGPLFDVPESRVDTLCALICRGEGVADFDAGKLVRSAKAQLALLALQPATRALQNVLALLRALAAFAESKAGAPQP